MRAKKKQCYIRAIELPHDSNPGKVEEIHEFLSLWRTALNWCKQEKIMRMKNGEPINRLTKDQWVVGAPPWLTQRQWKSVENQVNAALKSWRELAKDSGNKIVRKMYNDGLITEQEKKELMEINFKFQWWNKQSPQWLIKEILRQRPFPVFASLSATLDDIVCVPGSNALGHWVTISVLNKKRISIPVFPSEYYQKRMNHGDECSVTQVVYSEGKLRLYRMVSIPYADKRTQGEEIGIDWGVSTLMSTSNGDLLGRNLYDWMKKYDDQLMDLTKKLKANNIPLKKSKRYCKLVNRIRSYVKNTIGRILNSLSERDIKAIIVENLDFRGGGLSRKLNRILSKFGRSFFRQKLQSLEEEKGITIKEVNPAYTSRKCSGCGLVDKRSRTSQAMFACTGCNKVIHADVNAARNILDHSQLSDDGLVYAKKENVLSILDTMYQDNWGIDSAMMIQRPRAKKPSHALTAGLSHTSLC